MSHTPQSCSGFERTCGRAVTRLARTAAIIGIVVPALLGATAYQTSIQAGSGASHSVPRSRANRAGKITPLTNVATGRGSLSGALSWSASGDTIEIKAGAVTNNTSGSSGSLELVIWATASPYMGGEISGYILGTYPFAEPLGPYQSYTGIDETVLYTAPPTGVYYTTMTLEEYDGTAYVITDYSTFGSTSTFGAGGNPGAGVASVVLEGETSWQAASGDITMNAATILNNGQVTSGSLQLAVFATTAAYGGNGTLNGYLLGLYQFSSVLGPNQEFNNVSVTVPFTAPPNGTYYTTLVVEQYDGAEYVISDYVTYPATSTFGAPGGGSPSTVITLALPGITGIEAIVDGTSYTASQSFSWTQGSTHSISVPSAGGDTFLITASDGTGSGNPLQYTVTANPATLNVTVASTAPVPSTVTQLFPHLADGGEWQTEFLLFNTTSQTINASLVFHLDNGAATLNIQGFGPVTGITNIAVPPNGSALYVSAGSPSASLTSGWVEVDASSPIQGTALFRRHANLNGEYYEGSVPLATPTTAFTIPFDGNTFQLTGDVFLTGLAVANASSTVAATVTCSAFAQNGSQLGQNLLLAQLGGFGHTSSILQQNSTVGPVIGTQVGLLSCTASAPVGVLGLRFFGSAALSSIPVVSN